jgi:hypothetical protein
MIEYKLNSEETELFYVRVVASLLIIAAVLWVCVTKTRLIGVVGLFSFYALCIAFFFWFRNGLLVGYLRGNAVKITPTQFPDIYEIASRHCSEFRN